MVILKKGKSCKCGACQQYKGNDNQTYWMKDNIIYTTNCHSKNPKKARGIFVITSRVKIIRQ